MKYVAILKYGCIFVQINEHILRKYQNMINSLQKKKNGRKVYVVTRGISRSVYSNIKSISTTEKLNYWKVYRAIKKNGIYAEENVFIEQKPILK